MLRHKRLDKMINVEDSNGRGGYLIKDYLMPEGMLIINKFIEELGIKTKYNTSPRGPVIAVIAGGEFYNIRIDDDMLVIRKRFDTHVLGEHIQSWSELIVPLGDPNSLDKLKGILQGVRGIGA